MDCTLKENKYMEEGIFFKDGRQISHKYEIHIMNSYFKTYDINSYLFKKGVGMNFSSKFKNYIYRRGLTTHAIS